MGTRRNMEVKFDLVVFGEFFSDMIFYDLPDRPRFGEELKTDAFLVAPGGGLSTTAIAASRLGTSTGMCQMLTSIPRDFKAAMKSR